MTQIEALRARLPEEARDIRLNLQAALQSGGALSDGETGLPIVVEVMAVSQIPMMEKYVDVFQLGARNMQNFNLLRAVGETRRPVLF